MKYIPSLDGLRGIAVLLVIASHTAMPGISNGAIGVDIFFTLSGFLITSVLLSRRAGLADFYWRRFLRLFPAMVLVCVALIVAGLVALDGPQTTRDVLYGGLYVANWTRMWGNSDPMFLGHYWSLAVEEQFYLVWPVVFLLLAKLDHRRAIFAVAALTLIAVAWRLYLMANGASLNRLYNGSDTRADELLIGCTLALLVHERKPPDLTSGAMRYVVVLAIGFIAYVACNTVFNAPWITAVGNTGVALATALVIAAVLQGQHSWLNSALRWPPLLYVGRISYGLYLWHYPIAIVFHINNVPHWIAGLSTFVISIAVASLSFRYVERPILALKDALSARKTRRLGAAAVTMSTIGIALGIVLYWRPEIEYAIDPKVMQIEAYGPTELRVGEGFNVQPDGKSAFWFKSSRLVPRDTRLMIGDSLQPAPSINGYGLVAVDPVLVGTGALPMRFVGPTGEPRSTVVYLQRN